MLKTLESCQRRKGASRDLRAWATLEAKKMVLYPPSASPPKFPLSINLTFLPSWAPAADL